MLREKFNKNQRVILDADKVNTSLVYVVSQTPKLLYTEVKSSINSEETWSVMTYRLTEIK